MKAMLEPIIVAASIQIFACAAQGDSGAPDRITDSSQGGLMEAWMPHQANLFLNMDEPHAEVIEDQECGGAEAPGMIISRRPNKRASSENAPGPRQTRAIAITVAKAAVGLASNNSRFGAGNHENALPTQNNPPNMPATGVR